MDKVYTEESWYWCPDTEWTEIPDAHHCKALRGYGAVLGVFSRTGKCVGWIAIDKLGFATVAEWMAHQKATNAEPPRHITSIFPNGSSEEYVMGTSGHDLGFTVKKGE